MHCLWQRKLLLNSPFVGFFFFFFFFCLAKISYILLKKIIDAKKIHVKFIMLNIQCANFYAQTLIAARLKKLEAWALLSRLTLKKETKKWSFTSKSHPELSLPGYRLPQYRLDIKWNFHSLCDCLIYFVHSKALYAERCMYFFFFFFFLGGGGVGGGGGNSRMILQPNNNSDSFIYNFFLIKFKSIIPIILHANDTHEYKVKKK